MDRKIGFLERTAQLLDLPADAVAGVPRMELMGHREFRMEYHKGILAYGPEEIDISAGQVMVRLRGRDLALRAMNGEELLVTGEIEALEFT